MQRELLINRPLIGVGLLLIRRSDNKLLFGKRKNSHGADSWAPPGGHLEYGESPEECARREAIEETGCRLTTLATGPYTNDLFVQAGKHYITLWMIAHTDDEPQLCEPHKCQEWGWFDHNELPENLFLSVTNLLEKHSFNELQLLLDGADRS